MTGTEIETLVKAYAEGGIVKVPLGNQAEFANLLDLALRRYGKPGGVRRRAAHLDAG